MMPLGTSAVGDAPLPATPLSAEENGNTPARPTGTPPKPDLPASGVLAAAGNGGLYTEMRAGGMVGQVQRPPQSAQQLLQVLSRGVQATRLPFAQLDLAAVPTDITPKGVVMLKFGDGTQMSLDSFVSEMKSRHLLSPGAEIRVPIDRDEKTEVHGAAPNLESTSKRLGIDLVLYERPRSPTAPTTPNPSRPPLRTVDV
jgi:hypothetical protein